MSPRRVAVHGFVFRNVLNSPFQSIAMSVCSDRAQSVARLLKARSTRGVDQSRTVACNAAATLQPIGHALRPREHCVKVVALKQLGAAERDHIRVNVSPVQLSAQIIGTLLSFCKGGAARVSRSALERTI